MRVVTEQIAFDQHTRDILGAVGGHGRSDQQRLCEIGEGGCVEA